jgi:hypothetical protein
LPYCDSWPQAKNGWLTNCKEYQIEYSPSAKAQIEFLQQQNLDLKTVIQQQLRFSPTEKKKKRVKLEDEAKQVWVLSIRTWRVRWTFREDSKILIENIYSGYSANELSIEGAKDDKWADKSIHRDFQFFTNRF